MHKSQIRKNENLELKKEEEEASESTCNKTSALLKNLNQKHHTNSYELIGLMKISNDITVQCNPKLGLLKDKDASTKFHPTKFHNDSEH